MAKKAVDETPAELPEAEPAPEPLPAGHVRCVLKDEHERTVEHEFTVPSDNRDRVYHMPNGAYTHARTDADGTHVYRKLTH